MENENPNINRIRLLADSAVFDAPRNELTKSSVAFRAGDCARFDVVLLSNGALADCSGIQSLSFEILDIGAVNEPLLRSPEALLRKRLEAADINSALDADSLAAGGAHFSLALGSEDTSITPGNRYLKICAFDSSGDRTTFAAGWIKVFGDYSADLSEIRERSINMAQLLEGEIGAHESRLQTVEEALGDLSESSAETFAAHASSIDGLSSGKADKATTLAGYGIADAYTKTQTDAKISEAVSAGNAQLGLAKLNAGALHVANGAASNSTFVIPPVFSVAAIVSPDYVGDIIKLGALTISASSGVINAFNGIDEQGLSVFASTTKPNVVVFTQTVWGVLTVNSDSAAADMTAITGTGYTVGSSISASGAVSNLKIFNFDITAAGAPYTLDDYTAGKPVPPPLKGAFYQDIRANYAGYIQRYSTPSVSFVNGSNLELTVSDDSTSLAIDQYIAWQLPRKVKAGEKIKVSGRIILKTQSGSGYYGIQLFLYTTATSWGTGRQGIPATQSGNILTINAEYTLTGDAEYFGIMRGMNQGTGDKQYEIESFSVEVSGETLALENYVFDGEILDASANGNHATVSGSIEGDNDAAVEALYQKISARISNNS